MEQPVCTETVVKELSEVPLDLLFVVDNSASMHQEQAALRREFPRLVEVLTTGDRDGDGEADFPGVADLHLGVVSSDMGLPGIQGIPGCSGLGDDGVLNNRGDPSRADCPETFPRFLAYERGVSDVGAVAASFGCLSTMGTSGCGFEQPLESALKALWPASGVGGQQITFLGDPVGLSRQGQGDGPNAGFLREGSLLAVVVVTDEEDCSSVDTRHLRPSIYLHPRDPLVDQPLNLRCFYNPDRLHPVSRYVEGLKGLRPGAPHHVVFGAIAGVPPDLVDEDSRTSVDFADKGERDAFYDALLDDPRMREQIDPNAPAGGGLRPSCDTASGRAFPPRRITEAVRDFGSNGVLQSICQDDFGPAMDAIIDRLGESIRIATCEPAS